MDRILETIDADLAERLAAASNDKYPEYRMEPAIYRTRGAIEITPRKAVAWTHIAHDPTRFVFEERPPP